MPNEKFTARLGVAIENLIADPSLRAIGCRSGSLFSPAYRDGRYEWLKIMDSDGLLVSRRKIRAGEGATQNDVSLLLGVVVQSEDATSQTKPNPLGKASLPHIPLGVWVDLQGDGRRRLDRVLVVFVLPKGAAPNRQKKFETARRNVLNAADMMPDVISIEVPRGASAAAIAEAIMKEARPFLVGRGRPAHAA